MTQQLLEKMTSDEKVHFLLQLNNKRLIRNFCAISQSKLLMLELSHQNALKDFLKNRVEKMSDEDFHLKISKLIK